MSNLTRIPREDPEKNLPNLLRRALMGRKILLGWHTADGERVILWLLDQAVGNSVEVEWSEERGRLLTKLERCEVLAKPERFDLESLGISALRSEYIDDKNHRLSENFLVTSLTNEFAEFSCTQAIYSPARLKLSELLEQHVRVARFPSIYAQWRKDEKVTYWTHYLYRGRRQCGEDGQDEDVAFGPDVVAHMKDIDHEIEQLLPDIVQRLAMMDALDPRELAERFSKRTGYLVKVDLV